MSLAESRELAEAAAKTKALRMIELGAVRLRSNADHLLPPVGHCRRPIHRSSVPAMRTTCSPLCSVHR